MKNLLKKIIKWITREYTPEEDYDRNYCKYSKWYKSYKRQ
jgi:hypothetical protein